MGKIILTTFSFLFLLSCSSSRKLVYIDNWEGEYILRKIDRCCDSAMKVNLQVIRKGKDRYEWKMYFFNEQRTDTVFGMAVYENKRIGFFVENTGFASEFFVSKVNTNSAVFEMEWSNYYTSSEGRFVNYYTKWKNELRPYRASNALFAGIHYHFRSDSKKEKILPKE